MSKMYLLTSEDYEDFQPIAVYLNKDKAEERRVELMAPVLAFRRLQRERQVNIHLMVIKVLGLLLLNIIV